MKIYCGTRYKSDKEIFDSIIGKDVWVRVLCGPWHAYIRVLDKLGNSYVPQYSYNDFMCQSEEHPPFFPQLEQRQLDRLFEVETGPLTAFHIVKPLDICTTDEFCVEGHP